MSAMMIGALALLLLIILIFLHVPVAVAMAVVGLAATCLLDEARQLGDGALRVVVLLFPDREFLLQFCDLFASKDGHGLFASS